jgi:hypothetical protein
MSLFEFVTVMISMILALSLGRLLRSASYLAKTDRDVIAHRPYTFWFVVTLLAVINHWWSLWDLRGIQWNYASFLYVLAAPVLIAFAAGLITPDRSGSGAINIPNHFSRIRKLFSKIFVCYVFFMWFDGPLLGGQDVLGIIGILHVPIIAAASVPWISGDDRANLGAASVAIAALVVVVVARFTTMSL